MILCPKCEPPYLCCDHCKHFALIPESSGEGECKVHNKIVDIADCCDDYYCYQIDGEDNK